MGLCHDRVFYVATKFGQGQRVSCRDKILLGRDRVSQARSFLSRHNYVATKCGQIERFCVVTEQFYVAIVGQAGKIFCHD